MRHARSAVSRRGSPERQRACLQVVHDLARQRHGDALLVLAVPARLGERLLDVLLVSQQRSMPTLKRFSRAVARGRRGASAGGMAVVRSRDGEQQDLRAAGG